MNCGVQLLILFRWNFDACLDLEIFHRIPAEHFPDLIQGIPYRLQCLAFHPLERILYRNKGYDFTITSSTAYDHKWIYGRNIFESIDRIVDELFENYLSRPDVRQPILTQYCDGRQVQCRDRGWMTQWGSKALGDQGYSAIEILRSFYGNDMYINVAEAVSGIPASWPGYDLTIGVTGEKVQQIQEQLNAIAKAYPAIPSVIVDGIYGPATAASVKKFQNIFGLPASGVVDYPTWYKIQDIYVAVTRIAELQ